MVRVSSGHLCEAEAPTEAAAENAGSYFSLPFLRKGSGCRGNPCQVQDGVLRNGVETQEGEQKVSSGHFLRGETLVRGFPVCEAEAPTEAVDLRGRGVVRVLGYHLTRRLRRHLLRECPRGEGGFARGEDG